MMRRTFIISLVAAGGSVGTGLLIAQALWGHESITLELADVLTDPDSARHVGRAYLDQIPPERTIDRLTDLVFPSLRSAKTPPDREQVIRDFLSLVTTDYKNNDTVVLHGWILSRTEVRLCALIALG